MATLATLAPCVLNARVHAADCTWAATTAASWNDAANWTGCATGTGSPAGTPGAADRAILPGGTGKSLLLQASTSVGRLDMHAGAALGVDDAATTLRQLTVHTAATVTDATIDGALPAPGGPNPAVLSVVVPAGATLVLAGANTLRRAFIDQRGAATLVGGPGARLDFDLGGSYINAAGASSLVQGAFVFGYTDSGTLDNQGHLVAQGPGTVQLLRSGSTGGRFQCGGSVEIVGAAFVLPTAPAGFQANLQCSVVLRGGTFDATAQTLTIAAGKHVGGSGTLNGNLNITAGGTLDPQAANGAAVGLLNVSGNVVFAGAELVLDVEGPAAAQFDRVAIGGTVQWSRVRPRVRVATGYAPGIDTSFEVATHAGVALPNLPVHDRVLSDFPTSLALRVQPTSTRLRVVPTLAIADTQQFEANSGTLPMNFTVTLSAPTSEVVSFGYTTVAGTASSLPGSGTAADYNNASGTVTFAPGELAKQISVTIRGDTTIEADEAFAVVTDDGPSSPTLANASFGNNRRFSTAAEGRIRDDDSPVAPRYLLVGKDSNLPTSTGQVSYLRRYTTGGALVDGWPTQMTVALGHAAAGMCLAPNGDILSTRFKDAGGPVLMTPAGAVRDAAFGELIGDDESCVYDQQGNAWIGEAVPPSAKVALLRQIAPDGRMLRTLELPVGERGIDWIALDADQCTLYYTSEDSDLRRFDVCTEQALPDFANGLDEPCFTLRQLPNGELMLACAGRIYRFAESGAVLREYTRLSLGETNPGGLFALTLDPDGQTFWTAGGPSGRVVRARIDDGSVLTSFTTGSGAVAGLLVLGEFDPGPPTVLFSDGFEP